MHPKHLSPALLETYGNPQIRKVFGLTSTYHHPGRTPGWVIARQLAMGNMLTDKARTAFLSLQPRTEADWARVAEVEGIPAQGFTAPFATEQLATIQQRAKMTEITFDQDTFNTLYSCLLLYSTNAAALKTATYPLLDGPPGASKSLIANICAALLGLPVVTVTGSDGSADEIKIDLFGGDNANSKDLTGIVKDYIYHGWINHPLALKLVAQEQQTHILDNFRTETLLEISQHERLKDNITSFMPGKYQLASRHGYLLFLDETNGFKGVTTLLTQLLENYTNKLHPNFFVIGAMNPAGEKHNREPLPPEIRSRFNTIPVLPPSANSYYQMLHFYFSGEQPAITMPNGAQQRITGSMLGLMMPPRLPSVLKQALVPRSFTTFLENFAKFHKAIELKLEEGVIDPRNSTAGTTETLSIDRRTLSKCMQGIDTLLALKVDTAGGATDLSGGLMSMEEYNMTPKSTLDQTMLLQAIGEALDLFYVKPFNFPISEEIEQEKGKKKEFKSASEIVKYLLELHSLSPTKLAEYMKTSEDVEKLKAAWVALFQASSLYQADQLDNILKEAAEGEIKPDKKSVVFIRSSQSKQVSICALGYLATIASRKAFVKQNYPQLSARGSTGQSVATILDNRLGELSKASRRYIHKPEFQHVKEHQLDINRKFGLACFLVPLFDPTTDTISLAIGMPLCAFTPEAAAKRKKDADTTHVILMAAVRRGTEIPSKDELPKFIERLFMPDIIDFSAIQEEILLEYTVQKP